MIMDSKKKKEKVVKRHKINNLEDKKSFAIIIAISLIVFLIVFFFLNKKDTNYKNIKQDKNKYLVYTKYSVDSSKYPVQVPFVNIKSEPVNAINKDIDLFVNDFVKSKKCVVSYEYSISGIILSVVVKVIDYDTAYAPMPYFRSYNINLSTLEAISDQSLLDFFGVDDSYVEEMIEDKFHYYHEELISKEFYDENECDYSCFLRNRDVENYLDNTVYYVDQGNLVVFKPFSFYSIFGEEDYFKDENFKILLVEVRSE